MNCQGKQMIWINSFYKKPIIRECIMITIMLGFVWSLSSCALPKAKNYGDVVVEDAIFIHFSTGVVVDKRSNLMWAQADNGEKLNIDEAKAYARDSNLGGYTDWRLPDIKELESLMVYYQRNTTVPGDDCSGNYVIHPFFALTCCCPWALQDEGARPASYPFIKGIATGSSWHHRSHTMGNRVLPVRTIK